MKFTLLLLPFLLSLTAQASHLVRDQYIVFESRAEAEKWFREFHDSNADKMWAHSDSRYKNPELVLKKVWQGFERMFPERTVDLPVPELVIVEGNLLDGSAVRSPDEKMADMFYMMSGATHVTDEEMAGFFAHELTHLLFPDFQTKYYQTHGNEEPLGFLQTNDPVVERVITEWNSLTEIVGAFPLPELNSLPFSLIYDGKLFSFLNETAKLKGDPQNESCQRISQSDPEWSHDLIYNKLDFITETLPLSAEDLKHLEQKTRAYRADVISCLGHEKIAAAALMAQILKLDLLALPEKYKNVAAIFETQANAADGFFATVDQTFEKMRQFQKENNFSGLRYYSFEEIADDHSVRIMRSIGYSGLAQEKFLLLATESFQPGSSQKCLEVLNQGQIPHYGMLSDPHHSACYRIYHIRKLNEYFDSLMKN